jgi:hypothetical protein
MNPLNDDELNEMLSRAKQEPPRVSPAFDARMMREYERQVAAGQASVWRRLWAATELGHPFRWRSALGSAALILLGVFADRTLLATRAVITPRGADSPVVEERVVYQNCPVPSQGPGLTFNELQPVREIKPRVVRSMEDDQ